jgi:hypothetical protein
MGDLLATKPLDQLMKEASAGDGDGEAHLRRALGPVNLVALGVGAIIGAGIFVLSGTAAATFAGPSIVLSFMLAGVGCVFAGLCYAEFASMIPIAGSAYTYGYATLGELFAWIIGWDLIIEYVGLERLRGEPVAGRGHPSATTANCHARRADGVFRESLGDSEHRGGAVAKRGHQRGFAAAGDGLV